MISTGNIWMSYSRYHCQHKTLHQDLNSLEFTRTRSIRYIPNLNHHIELSWHLFSFEIDFKMSKKFKEIDSHLSSVCEVVKNQEPKTMKANSCPLWSQFRQTLCISVSRWQSSSNCSFSMFSGCSVQLFCLCVPAACAFIVCLNPGGQFKHKHSTSSKIEKEQCTKRS